MAVLLIAYVVSEIIRPSGETWPAVDGWGVASFGIAGSLLCIYQGVRSRATRGIQPCTSASTRSPTSR